jgi:hypothetical protein
MPGYRNTVTGTIAGNDESVTLPYRHHTNGGVGVQVSGTFVGTLQFELTINGTNYVPVIASDVTAGTDTTNTTTSGVFRFDVVGVISVRVRSTAWTSGDATVTIVGLAG